MAFVQSAPISQRSNNVTVASKCAPNCTQMSSSTPSPKNTSRRAVLRLFATGIATSMMANVAYAAVKGADDNFDLKELKKDVEELKYEDEVIDVGPDDREKNITRIKKKVPEPEFRAEEKELVQKEDEAYDTMVAKEKDDEAKIKAKFSKAK